ncbi:MAG: CDP-diacylglycerol diphosphatase, partial [Hyphomicrobiales bacterium]|nr:CDP-diacylglycerol diphosphatase [Hyphomicrobiales bacterium]MBV8662876.1 CDP-diacylglycerol diphosphatase [Hyphomicrobiales bacterium]
ANAATIGDQWAQMKVALKGRTYWARRLDPQNLSGPSPFQLVADGLDGAKADMAAWSLAAMQVNVGGRPNVILLADRYDGAAGGRASDLQDPACAIAAR